MSWWDDEMSEQACGVLTQEPYRHGDAHRRLTPAAAARLARWVRGTGDQEMFAHDGAATAETVAWTDAMPAMKQAEGRDLLNRIAGPRSLERQERHSDEALVAIADGVRRAASAFRRMKTIGCYLVELHPARHCEPE